MKQPHKHAELIKAWADGAEIEYWNDYRKAWVEPDYINPINCAYLEWRIKPEPKPDVVMYAFVGRTIAKQLRVLHLIERSCGPDKLRLTFDGETGKLKKAEVLE